MNLLRNWVTLIRDSQPARSFYARDVSERRIIVGLAILVTTSLLWMWVWQPVSDWQQAAAQRHTEAQQLVDWIRINETALRQSVQGNDRAGQGRRAIIPIITRAATTHALTLNRLQPESNGMISVVLQRQSFDQIIKWLSQLHENNEVYVVRASFDRVDAEGYVNAQLRLE